MKQIFLTMLLLPLLLIGCGGDDNGTDPGNGDPVVSEVTASTTATAPAMTSVNEATWNNVTATAIEILPSEFPPTSAGKISTLADSIYVKAIVASGRLYLRLEWDDDSLHMDCETWILTDSNMNFNHMVNSVYNGEDQLYVMFEDSGNSLWDTWNWRVLTTATANRAEGLTYNGTEFTGDNGASQVGWQNISGDIYDKRPKYIHKDMYEFTGRIMYIEDIVESKDGMGNPNSWTIGQTVPGYFIDTSILKPGWQLESRWDIEAIYDYSSTSGRYVVVLTRDLDGFSDDLDLTDLTRVKVKIGIVDNLTTIQGRNSILVGNDRRGMTKDFWLILQ